MDAKGKIFPSLSLRDVARSRFVHEAVQALERVERVYKDQFYTEAEVKGAKQGARWRGPRDGGVSSEWERAGTR